MSLVPHPPVVSGSEDYKLYVEGLAIGFLDEGSVDWGGGGME